MDKNDNWIISALSEEQRGPLRRTEPNASILAAAGSGKTRTLVHLVLSDIANGVPPSSIVAFTFTEKAAGELLARIHSIAREKLPGVDLTGLFVGTIHSWCLQYLLGQPEYYNISSMDELHVDAMVSRLYDVLELGSTYSRPYPRAIPYFLADIEIFYNEGLSSSNVPERIRNSVETFLAMLRDNHLMTFGGMVDNAWRHLRAVGGLPSLNVVYVDEYQDVNPAQVNLISSMVGSSGRVVVVGDDLQCIYNWRGSDVRRIIDFTSDFPSAKAFRLSENYRSRPSIVLAANDIASHIKLRDPQKVMLPKREDEICPVVHWLSTPSELDQAEAVATIASRFIENGIPPRAIAVLLRSVSGSGRPIVNAMQAAGVPVVCPTLSRAGAFIREFILPLLDWVRQEHPEPRNELEEIKAEESAATIWNLVGPWVRVNDPETVFWEGLNKWLDDVDAKSSSGYDVRGRLYDLMEQCGIGISHDDSDLMVGVGIASQILRSIEEIHRRRFAGQNRRTPRGVTSEAFFAVLRMHEKFGESIAIEKLSEGVVVSTVHQSKGLEWPIVIIPMLRDGKFPIMDKPHGTSYPDAVAGRYGTHDDDERRLFYVAMTRAKERVFLIDPELARTHKRSPFITEALGTTAAPVTDVTHIPKAVWSLSEDDLKDSDPPPLRLGLSDVLIYMECPFQFALSRVANIEPSVGDELGYGKSLHELIQTRLEADAPWDDKALDAAAKKHVLLPLMSADGEAKARETIKSRVKDLSQIGVLDEKVETEIDVEMILPHGIVQGVVDVVQVASDASIAVRDWKSSLHDGFLPRYQAQLQFYSEALRRKGRSVKAADIVDVKSSAETGRVVAAPVDISTKTTKITLDAIDAALDGIGKGEYPAKPNASTCEVCDMSRICGERCKT